MVEEMLSRATMTWCRKAIVVSASCAWFSGEKREEDEDEVEDGDGDGGEGLEEEAPNIWAHRHMLPVMWDPAPRPPSK
jgi:hypothetical protein